MKLSASAFAFSLSLSLAGLPLPTRADCPEADRQAFLASHAPAVRSCKPGIDHLCVDNLRLVDDTLYEAVVDPHPVLFPQVREDQVRHWPRATGANSASHVPPGTFVIVDDALRLDLTRRTVFATCDGSQVYLRDAGGFNGTVAWYGPIAVSTLSDLKARRER